MDLQRRHTLSGAMLAGSLAAGAAVCPAWLRAATPAMRSVVIALGARQSLYHLPLLLAERLGFARQSGLALQLQMHESGAQALASVLQGKADAFAGAFEHLFHLQHKGLFFQAFVQMNTTPMLSLGVGTGRGAPRTWTELKAARIGVSALDSASHWLAGQWLQRNGLSVQDVQFVEVGSSAGALGALWEGRIDALCNPDPLMHWLEQRGEIRLLAETRSNLGVESLAAGPLPGACLMAKEEFVLRQTPTVALLAQALVQALRWLQTAGPTDLFKVMPVAPWVADRAVYLAALEKLRQSYSRDGMLQEDHIFNAWRAYARISPHPPTSRNALARTFTNSFVARLRA